MPCDFINVGLYQEHFQKNIEALFRYTVIQQKTMRLFIFKIKAFYFFFSLLLCSAVFEHDKHVQPRPRRIFPLSGEGKKEVFKIALGTRLKHVMITRWRIFVLKASMMIKRKQKFNKIIDEISSGFH